jgi:ribonucleoside-diphosphate reductase alpha subunit
MRVKKRDGSYEDVSFDKVIRRIKNHSNDLKNLDPTGIAQYVCARIYDGVPTSELDELTAQICSSYITEHPEYGILSSRIIISNHHKNTSPSFSEVATLLYNKIDINGVKNPLVSEELMNVVNEHKEKLNDVIDYEKDYNIDFFGFKTLERSYLLKIDGKIIERPQHLFMRVAIGIHGNDIKEVIETYEHMSNKMFIHATPTLFNAGTPRSQMASCFLQAMKDDSIEGIFDTLKSCAHISKYSGGVGLHVHDVRSRGAYIKGTNGTSNGIIPMLSVYNKTAMYVDQCFRGDTNVYTLNGTKKIEKIRENDMVLTSDGTFHKVLRKIVTKINKDTYRVRTNNSIDTVYVTPEHQIYALTDVPSLPVYELKNYMQNNLNKKAKYVDLKSLTTFDYVGYPIPIIENEIECDEAMCLYSGILLGNGYTENGIQYVSFYKDKGNEMKNNLIKFLNKYKVEYSSYIEKNRTILKWNNQEGVRPIKNFLQLSKECVKIFLKGLLKSNGCKINDTYNCMFYNVDDSKKYMCYYVKYLFLRLGVLVDGFYKSENKYNVVCIPYCDELFEIFDYKDKKSDIKILNYFELDDVLWTGIKSIDKMKNFEGYVYDLNVHDNHSYVTEMGIVHNSGKRNGNFAIYLEPSHPDIESFIDLRKNHGNEAERCRELFTALWIPDLFMEKVKNDEEWCLFCPNKCPGLSDVYDEDYKKLYEKYCSEKRYEKKIKAQDLWKNICIAQKETGTPYICYKDSCNRKSNQKNLGAIKSSNLCAEIIEYSDSNETAVCNLASIALPMYVENGEYNYEKLYKISKIVTKNLNKVIDKTFYPLKETEVSNKRHRPIGIGVQGLADVYALMNISFDSDEAKEINKKIFETIYYGALTMSMELSEKYGSYDSYNESPISKGLLQFDLWNVVPSSGLWSWEELKEKIKKNGVRNSLLLALMPTASTSQILGFNECFEPFTNNIYNRRTLAGEFFIINKYLINKLIELKIWNKDIKNKIIENKGSVQDINEIPEDIRKIFKTAYELHPKAIIDQSADRGAYICQSQSMNIFLDDPDITKLSNMHFYSWKKGLKTGIYYLRTRPKARVQSFSLEGKKYTKNNKENEETECLSCGA